MIGEQILSEQQSIPFKFIGNMVVGSFVRIVVGYYYRVILSYFPWSVAHLTPDIGERIADPLRMPVVPVENNLFARSDCFFDANLPLLPACRERNAVGKDLIDIQSGGFA